MNQIREVEIHEAITVEQLEQLGEALRVTTTVQSISFNDSPIGDTGAEILARALKVIHATTFLIEASGEQKCCHSTFGAMQTDPRRCPSYCQHAGLESYFGDGQFWRKPFK